MIIKIIKKNTFILTLILIQYLIIISHSKTPENYLEQYNNQQHRQLLIKCNYKCRTCENNSDQCTTCSDGTRDIENKCECKKGLIQSSKNPKICQEERTGEIIMLIILGTSFFVILLFFYIWEKRKQNQKEKKKNSKKVHPSNEQSISSETNQNFMTSNYKGNQNQSNLLMIKDNKNSQDITKSNMTISNQYGQEIQDKVLDLEELSLPQTILTQQNSTSSPQKKMTSSIINDTSPDKNSIIGQQQRRKRKGQNSLNQQNSQDMVSSIKQSIGKQQNNDKNSNNALVINTNDNTNVNSQQPTNTNQNSDKQKDQIISDNDIQEIVA